jgi:hypothetical protein
VARAREVGNKEQASRAELWMAVFAARNDRPGATDQLKETLAGFDPQKSMPAWTRQLVDEGTKLLDQKLGSPT